jgi:hypothetical protein
MKQRARRLSLSQRHARATARQKKTALIRSLTLLSQQQTQEME